MKNITGERFGKLTAIKFIRVENKYGKNRMLWGFKCDCGNYIEKLNTSALKRPKTMSCGCSSLSKRMDVESGVRRIMKIYQTRAVKNNLEFSLSYDRFKELIQSNCNYCGEKGVNFVMDKFKNIVIYYNGIDRMNNLLGYSEANSITACKVCNFSKGTKNQEDFKKYIIKVYNYISK